MLSYSAYRKRCFSLSAHPWLHETRVFLSLQRVQNDLRNLCVSDVNMITRHLGIRLSPLITITNKTLYYSVTNRTTTPGYERPPTRRHRGAVCRNADTQRATPPRHRQAPHDSIELIRKGSRVGGRDWDSRQRWY